MTATSPVIEANRRGKREQIIDAAKLVLAQDGLAACTVRAVADASSLSKSAVHYYFDDIHQIVDLAMGEHVAAMVTNLRQAAGEQSDPAEKLWAVVEIYLATFAAQPNAAFLWFEYWIDTSHRRAADSAAATLADVRALLSELVMRLRVDTPAGAANAVLSWLLGTVVQQQIGPRPVNELRDELSSIIGNTPR